MEFPQPIDSTRQNIASFIPPCGSEKQIDNRLPISFLKKVMKHELKGNY